MCLIKKMTKSRAQSNYSNNFTTYFKTIKDPRRTSKGNIKYPLVEILFQAVSSILCGYSDFQCIEEFGILQLDWLRKYYPYANCTCSHDVIGKLFQKIDYTEFSNCVMQWAKQFYQLTEDELVTIDGKRIRGSYDIKTESLASHIVSAYLSSQEICIGQVATEEKSNEITAIPVLLDSIEIAGAIVSIDAMGCQKEIATKIVSKGANYILAVKENQQYLSDDIVDIFASKLVSVSKNKTLEINHGRVEKRVATVLTNLSLFSQKDEWENCQSLIKIETERYVKATGKSSFETRYYISSCTNPTAKKMNECIRGHWAIENKLHWNLDVIFGEDDSRRRIGNAAKNFNLVLKMALTLLERTKDVKKISKRRKMMKAMSNIEYRESIMKV